MKMPNAVKICNSVGSYTRCDKCPIYDVCRKQYSSTEEFEKTLEKAAAEYLKSIGKAEEK